MGYTGREVGRYLNIRGYSAIRRAAHGKEIVDKHSQIVESWQRPLLLAQEQPPLLRGPVAT